MPSFETLLFLFLGVGAAVTVYTLVSVLSRGGAGAAATALSQGNFEAALNAVLPQPSNASRSETMAAALAAKHLMRLEDAASLLDRLLAEDPVDQEAALERGLVAAYAQESRPAERFFGRAAARPDLTEALTLHRAWLKLDSGDPRSARALFEEIEAPLETKLRTDLGTGDPEFAEWFLQAAALWRAFGWKEKAEWAQQAGEGAAAASRLPERISSAKNTTDSETDTKDRSQ